MPRFHCDRKSSVKSVALKYCVVAFSNCIFSYGIKGFFFQLVLSLSCWLDSNTLLGSLHVVSSAAVVRILCMLFISLLISQSYPVLFLHFRRQKQLKKRMIVMSLCIHQKRKKPSMKGKRQRKTQQKHPRRKNQNR